GSQSGLSSGKHFLQLGCRRTAPVLAEIEGFRMLDFASPVGSIPVGQRRSCRSAGRMAPVGAQPLTAGAWVLRHLMRYAVYPRKPFVEQRSMGIQSVHFPFPHVADIHCDVGCEWNRPAKMVFEVQKDRV